MAIYRETPTCEKCGKQIKSINRPNDGIFIGDDFIKWDYEGHKCSESRVKLLKLAKDMKIMGLVDALTNPKVNQACEDMQKYGWILLTTDSPEEQKEVLVTDGKRIDIDRWFNGLGFTDSNLDVVAWIYKPDLSQLQNYLKKIRLDKIKKKEL